MTTTITTITAYGERFVVAADWAQASDPIVLDFGPTPYQVGSFSHDKDKAIAQIMRDYIRDSGGGCCPHCGEDAEEEDGGWMCGGDDDGDGCEGKPFWKIEDNNEDEE